MLLTASGSPGEALLRADPPRPTAPGACSVCGAPIEPRRARRGAKRCGANCARAAERRRKGFCDSSAPAVPTALRSALSLSVVEGDLARRGWFTYRATAPGGPADLVAVREGRWLTIRVRTGREDARGRIAVPVLADAEAVAVVVPMESGADRVVYCPSLEGGAS